LKAKLATANAAFSEKHEAAARAVAQMDRDLGALLDAHGRLTASGLAQGGVEFDSPRRIAHRWRPS